jgi:hypothetical protein
VPSQLDDRKYFSNGSKQTSKIGAEWPLKVVYLYNLASSKSTRRISKSAQPHKSCVSLLFTLIHVTFCAKVVIVSRKSFVFKSNFFISFASFATNIFEFLYAKAVHFSPTLIEILSLSS